MTRIFTDNYKDAACRSIQEIRVIRVIRVLYLQLLCMILLLSVPGRADMLRLNGPEPEENPCCW